MAVLDPAAAVSGAEQWRAVVERNHRFDGVLFYGVKSTGIYCKPSCPSRRPKPENVRFFFDPQEAEGAGFRACLRCQPKNGAGGANAEVVRRLCRYIEENLDSSLSLSELAARVKLSSEHAQRVFKQVTGISPRQYIELRRLSAFKFELRTNRRSVTEATYEAGYGSSSRIYEKAASQLGMTPAQYRRGGEGTAIRFTVADTVMGKLLMAATEKGICRLTLGDSAEDLEQSLRAEYPRATVDRDDDRLRDWVRQAVATIESDRACDLPLDIRATAFQRRVYEALKRIPRGETRSYSEIAKEVGMPSARRAVARACATNPVAVIVPCHRVIRSDGDMGGYRWGLERKKKLLAAEKGAGPRNER